MIDDLRAENADLKTKVATLEKNAAARVAELDRLNQQLTTTRPAGAGVPGVEPSDIPHVTSLKFDRYTGAIDSNKDGIDDVLRVYVLPLDAKDRFIPATGSATLQLVALPPGKPPIKLVERSYTPKEFDAAYRTGFTGTHYSFELPLPSPVPPEAALATLKMTFTDADTGATIEHEESVTIKVK